jgi:hypothetical protein
MTLVRTSDGRKFSFFLTPDKGKVRLNLQEASFKALTAVMFQVEIFWVVTPCSAVVGYRRFGGPCYLHLEGEDSSRDLLGCDAM